MFYSVRKNAFSPLKPIVNNVIAAIILTFFVNGKKIPNFVQVLIRMPTMNDKDMGKISTLVPNSPKQARVFFRVHMGINCF